MACLVTAAACGSEASNPDGSAAEGGAGGTGGAGGAGGADVVARTCKSGDPCSEGAKCSYWYTETGVYCSCDPSGHFLCDPGGGGGAPPWPPCTEPYAKESFGACEPPATTCTETNGWCTRTCTCGSTCEMTCDGDGDPNGKPGVLCDASYCDGETFGGEGCEFVDGDCNYKVSCGSEGDVTVTGACP
jgi:hypothetical protein